MSAILTAVSTLNCELRLSRSATLIKASTLNCAFLVVMSAITDRRVDIELRIPVVEVSHLDQSVRSWTARSWSSCRNLDRRVDIGL